MSCMLAGTPQRYVISLPGEAPHGAFDGASFCQRCRFIKPLEAHHCR